MWLRVVPQSCRRAHSASTHARSWYFQCVLRGLLQLSVVLLGVVISTAPTNAGAQQRRAGRTAQIDTARAGRARHARRTRQRVARVPEAEQIAKLLLDEARVANASRELYAEPQTPELAQNAALVFERARQYGRAARVLERYLEESPDALDRDAVEARIAYLRELDARRRITRVRQDVVRASLVSTEETTRPSATRIAGLALLGGGAASAVAAYVTGLMAEASFSGADSACATGTCPAALDDDMSLGSNLTIASRVLAGVAIASASVGLVLVVVGGNAAPTERRSAATAARPPPVRAQVEVVPGPIPTGIGARLRF